MERLKTLGPWICLIAAIITIVNQFCSTKVESQKKETKTEFRLEYRELKFDYSQESKSE